MEILEFCSVQYYNGAMNTYVTNLLGREGIEYFGLLPLSECRVINPDLLARSCADFTPRSVIMLGVPYYTGEHPGRTVSLYAVSKDYHLYFRQLFQRLEPALEVIFPGFRFKGFADHSPIDETYAAAKAGLGVVGDKFQLINEIYGSYVFLGEILTDVIFEEYDTCEVRTCLHCGACQRACPVTNGCLSEMTQRKGDLDEETTRFIRKTGIAWGCDLCRTSCPMNRKVKLTPISFFWEDLRPTVTAAEIEAMPKTEFLTRAYSWRGRPTILRNLRALEKGE